MVAFVVMHALQRKMIAMLFQMLLDLWGTVPASLMGRCVCMAALGMRWLQD
jgi:hypothetical protein